MFIHLFVLHVYDKEPFLQYFELFVVLKGPPSEISIGFLKNKQTNKQTKQNKTKQDKQMFKNVN